MLASNIKTVRNDMRTLIRDAQDLFREATATSGDKADELRHRGLILLDTAMERAQDLQAAALATSKDVAQNTNVYVRENPWKALAISAGVGLAIGMLLPRK